MASGPYRCSALLKPATRFWHRRSRNLRYTRWVELKPAEIKWAAAVAGVPMRGGHQDNGPPTHPTRLAYFAGALASLSSCRSSEESCRRVAAARLSSCSTEVALAIGAVTLGRAMSQASATVAGVVSLRVAPSTSASTMRSPRSLRYFSTNELRAPFAMSAFERYFPLRKPLARLKYVTTVSLCACATGSRPA